MTIKASKTTIINLITITSRYVTVVYYRLFVQKKQWRLNKYKDSKHREDDMYYNRRFWELLE